MSLGVLTDAGKASQKACRVKSAAARAKGDVVYLGLDGDGYVDITLADDILVHCIGVWDQDVASGESGLVITGGPATATVASANYTEGNGLAVLDGAVVDTAAAYPAAAGVAGEAQTVFGSVTTTVTASTSVELFLHGEKFTATT